MADNYDDVCSLCGRAVNTDTLYYCCPECHKMHRRQKDNDKNECDSVTKEAFKCLNQIEES